MNNNQMEIDKYTNFFKFTLGTIVALGIIMVYSASYMFAKENYGTSTHFFFRQLIFLVVSLVVALVVSKTKFRFWLNYSFQINIFASMCLILTFIPGLGTVVKGANRWISVGGFTVQPGEFVKYTCLLSSIYFFENFFKMEKDQKIKHGLSLLFPLALLINQPDFGTFAICCSVMAFACFLSNFPRKYFYSTAIIAFVSALLLMVSQPYRVKRLMAFLDPWKNAQGSGFQVIQSWIGFANGSIFGKGAGNSIEKLFYLPEAHNDFIFSVIGEEFGFFGVFCLIGLFVAMIYFGFKLAILVKDRMGFLLISTIVFTIGFQALLNMGVVLGLLPTKGLNLPLISYGGSSLLSNFFAIGLVLSVIKSAAERHSMTFGNDKETSYLKTAPNTGFQSMRSGSSSNNF
jgi:cell division protein FtsW